MPAKKTDTPTPVDLNLDALEREGSDAYKPFVFTLGGVRFETVDLNDEDWQVLAEIDERNPRAVLKMVLGEKQFEKFTKQKLPAWKLNKLMEAYYAHNGLPSPGEAAASSES